MCLVDQFLKDYLSFEANHLFACLHLLGKVFSSNSNELQSKRTQIWGVSNAKTKSIFNRRSKVVSCPLMRCIKIQRDTQRPRIFLGVV